MLTMTCVDIVVYLNELEEAKRLIQEKLKERENRPKQTTLCNLWETEVRMLKITTNADENVLYW